MKASLNFIQLLEQRAKEPDYTTKIVGYSGDIGRVYRNVKEFLKIILLN